MKLNTEEIKDYEVEEGGESLGSGEVSIDTANMGLFYEMMSKSIYKDPHGSIVRELVSNCFDAHVEIGVTKPVVIKGGYEELDYYISFQDFGVGISEQRFHDVYLKYLSSSKRHSNEMMGAFGLGSKSPFSYTQMFYILTRHEGIEYYYVMSKGQNAKPNWDLLYKKSTEEPSGTIIKFQVEGAKGSGDWQNFREAIVDQLRYFDDVYTDDFSLDNEYKILDYKTFKFRVGTEHRKMHISLGKVTYPIDWEMLKRPEINIPVGVKFDIGELMITPNRESIRYNDELILFINKRIDECLLELKSLTKESTYDDLRLLVEANKNNKDKFIRLEDDVELLIYEGSYGYDKKNNPIRYPFSIPKPQFKPFIGTPIEVPSENPFFLFRPIMYQAFGVWTTVNEESRNNRGLPHKYNDLFYTLTSNGFTTGYRTSSFKINKLKLAYIKSLSNSKVIFTKNKSIGIRTYLSKLGLNGAAKPPFGRKLLLGEPFINEQWNKTKLVKLYKRVMTNEIIKITESYDTLIIPSYFEEKYRADTRIKRVANDGEILYLDIDKYTAEGGSKETKTNIKLKELNKGMIIYGSNKQKSELVAIQKIINPRKSLNNPRHFNSGTKALVKHAETFRVIMLNNIDLPKMEGENHTSLEKFLKHRVFIEQATAYYIYQKHEALSLGWAIDYVPAIKKWLLKLNKFMVDSIGYDRQKYSTMDNKFVLQFIEIALQEGLLIKEYIDIVDVLTLIDEDLQLLSSVSSKVETIEDEREIASYLVRKGYKVDPIYITKFTNEELDYINAYVKYPRDRYAGKVEHRNSLKELMKEAYEARNKNYSLYTPFTWHTNFPTFGTNKSAKISMLSLEITQ